MRGRVGLTIIEALVAIVLLGVVAALVASALPGIVGLNRNSAADVDATLVVREVFEIVRTEWRDDDQWDLERVGPEDIAAFVGDRLPECEVTVDPQEVLDLAGQPVVPSPIKTVTLNCDIGASTGVAFEAAIPRPPSGE